MSEKIFVLDTNVLLHDSEAVVKFPGQQVVLPIGVMEELDRLKGLRNELGRSARAALGLLDALPKVGEGNFHIGLHLSDQTILQVAVPERPHQALGLDWGVGDNRILATAFYLKEKGHSVVFVSKNIAARIKAEALGLSAENYRNLRASFDQIARGVPEFDVQKEEIDCVYKEGRVSAPKAFEHALPTNFYCHLTAGEQSSILVRYLAANKELERLQPLPKDLWGIEPLNLEQRCALDLLVRDDIPLVTLLGPAGTGKTLLTLAAALQKVFDQGRYNRLLVSRPIVPLGRDIGYLPGTKEEKLTHWMQPIQDNLEVLCNTGGNEPTDTLRYIIDSPKFEMEAVTYIRGRTLPSTFMVIDEAQNLTPHEVKTIVSRAGHNTKVVLTGDPSQIDNPYLDRDSNGLTYTVSRMADSPLFGHVYLEKTERSALAALAADVL